MKKHLLVVVLIAFLGLFIVPDAVARKHDSYHKHPYKEQKRIKKAYYLGYKQGMREAYRYERRMHPRAYSHGRHYRPHRRHVAVPVPPMPPVRGGSVSVHIPLPPHPGLR